MKKRLYFGLECPQNSDVTMIHYPLITTTGLPKDTQEIKQGLLFARNCSHVIVTSKMAVRYLFALKPLFASDVCFISVGRATTKEIENQGHFTILTSSDESQEGIISLLSHIDSSNTSFFWPHSSRSRNNLLEFLQKTNYSFFSCVIYETHKRLPKNTISFDDIDELFFSSPSTVDAFFEFFQTLPKGKRVLTQGPITTQTLKKHTMECL